jgi:hypothetical protein
MSVYTSVNITPQLIDRAILATNPIIYINHPDLEFRDRFIGRLSTHEAYQWQIIEANKEHEDLHTLLKLLEDPDIETQQWAVASIVELGIVEVFPIVLKLANHPELVETLIWELKQSYELSPDREIFNEFHRDREVTIEFLETAEKSLIKAIEDDKLYQ